MRDEIAALHAKTNIYRTRLKNARRIVASALEIGPSPYVAFSGGKDSTVVAALVRELNPSIPLVWVDDEWNLPETEAYIKRMDERSSLEKIRISYPHTDWFVGTGEWENITDYTAAQSYDLAFLGLRQEENSRRRIHLRRFGPLFYAEKNQQWQCNPVHDWTWQDVWSFIVTEQLDYNRAYDRLEEIGVPPGRQRIGPLAVERALGYGQIAVLKRGWPDLFNRFAAEFPEARGYA